MPTREETVEILKKSIEWNRHGIDVPTYIHSVRVGELLKKHGFSEDVQYAGLLHDIVEDGWYSFEKLKELGYSNRTIELVDLSTFDMELGDSKQAWVKMMERLILVDDKEAWAVKLADIADNLTECHHCEHGRAAGYLFRNAPIFIYYGNKYFAGTDLYNQFLETYWDQVRRYHNYFQ